MGFYNYHFNVLITNQSMTRKAKNTKKMANVSLFFFKKNKKKHNPSQGSNSNDQLIIIILFYKYSIYTNTL